MQQQVLHEVQEFGVEAEVVREVNEDLASLRNDLRDLLEIAQSTAEMVQLQEGALDHVENVIEEANAHAEDAVFELAMAGREQASGNYKLYIAEGAATGAIVGVGVGAIGGPATAAASAAALATVGGAIGGGIGKLVSIYKNHVIDNVLIGHQHDTLRERFHVTPEEQGEPVRCTKCSIEYGMFTPAKLCRICGFYFCSPCRKSRLLVKYRGIEKLKDVPVCDFCARVYRRHENLFKEDTWILDKSWWQERQEIVDQYQSQQKSTQ
eukprot:TRINITY_DN5160_c0_g1_i1.p1 TRINITY_DN5160_c0_g1~~TRINITY_DN5160_c0_g1_i1.p1  ORF type:complete len:278 (-),score=41.73 TRINITY_DN5160_c0_g1_i1:98-895(-)